MSKRNEEQILLTPELYNQIMSVITSQTVDLKMSQNSSKEKISSDIKILKDLREKLVELEQKIEDKENELNLEKKSLRKTNQDLKVRRKLSNTLNIKFTSTKPKTLILKKFQKKLGI